MPKYVTFHFINWVSILILIAGLCLRVLTGFASANSTSDPALEKNNLQIEDDPVTNSGWNSDDSIFAISRLFSGLYLYDQNMQQVGFIPIIAGGGVGETEWNPTDPELIAIIAASMPNSSVEVWNVQSATQIFATELFLSDFTNISWNSDGSQLAIVGGSIGEVWDISTGTQAYELNRTGDLATDWLYVVDWNPTQDIIATDGVGQESVLWDATSGDEISSFPHVGYIAWSPDGDKLALLDDALEIYDLNLGRVSHIFPNPNDGAPMTVQWEGDTLVVLTAVVASSRFVQVIDTTTFEVIETIELDYTPKVALTSDGALLTLIDNAGTIDLRRIQPASD